jgi:hypothetical protein
MLIDSFAPKPDAVETHRIAMDVKIIIDSSPYSLCLRGSIFSGK